jgi:hypothetical protein
LESDVHREVGARNGHSKKLSLWNEFYYDPGKEISDDAPIEIISSEPERAWKLRLL